MKTHEASPRFLLPGSLLALLLAFLPGAQATQSSGVAPPAGIDAQTWQKAGPELRWVLYRDSVDQRTAPRSRWIEFLEATRDFETLESICVYEGFRGIFQKGNPGEILARLKAPQRMRVGLWNLSNFDSHNVEASRSPLTNEPAVFVAWAKKFPAVRALGGAALLKKFQQVQPGAVGDLLPPLDPAELLLPMLDAPRELSTLRVGQAFDKGRRYRFQVLRAIQALSIAGKFQDPYRSKLLRLTRHQDPLVRRAAMLEFSQFPSASIPWSELLGIANNETLEAADRGAALLAASFATHPAVTLELHRVLKTPTHPGIDAVVQRSYEVGTGMTLRILETLPRNTLPETLRSRVAALHKTLAKSNSRRPWPPHRLIFLNVWAEFTEDPLLPVVKAWTEPELQQLVRTEQGEKAIRKLLKNPEISGARKFLLEKIKAEAERVLR